MESSSYAVRAVMDRRTNRTLSFHDAVSRGIIDRDTGAYHDTKTGKSMLIGRCKVSFSKVLGAILAVKLQHMYTLEHCATKKLRF